MTDYYQIAENGFVAKMITLTDHFPAGTGKSAGWQVSDDDTVIAEGGEKFCIYRPGSFPTAKRGKVVDFEWHIIAVLHMRFSDYEQSWPDFKTFRSDVINLFLDDPTMGKTVGVWDVFPAANEEPGYLQDSDGNSTNIIVQTLDVTIRQRVLLN